MIFYTGNSMKGVFAPGDTLELEAVPFSELRPGDIVAIDAERPYVHRVIRIEKGRIITQGDNNPQPDEQPLTPDRSFQKVTGAAAFDGSPRRFRSGENGITDFRHHQRRRRFRTALLAVSRNIGRVFSRRFELRDRLDFKGASAMGASASSSPAEVRRARSVSANRFTVFFSVFRKKNKRRDISAVRKAVHAPCQGIATFRPVRLSHSSCRNVKFEGYGTSSGLIR